MDVSGDDAHKSSDEPINAYGSVLAGELSRDEKDVEITLEVRKLEYARAILCCSIVGVFRHTVKL